MDEGFKPISICGVPLVTELEPLAIKDQIPRVELELAELADAPVKVVSVRLNAVDPPRYTIKFSADKPMWLPRTHLEQKSWDVGTETLPTGGLAFYATKPLNQTTWKV